MNPVFDKVYAPPRFTEVLPVVVSFLFNFLSLYIKSISRSPLAVCPLETVQSADTSRAIPFVIYQTQLRQCWMKITHRTAHPAWTTADLTMHQHPAIASAAHKGYR